MLPDVHLTPEQVRITHLEQQVTLLAKQFEQLQETAYQTAQKATPPMAETVYLCEQVAQAVGLKKQTLYRKFKRGQIPQGEIWRYSPEGRIIVNLPKLQRWMVSAPQV